MREEKEGFSRNRWVPIVAVGLSAGGLQPLKQIFQQLSPNTGMAFVVISHLKPGLPTSLPHLLLRWSPMPSELVRGGVILRPNHIYVIPPGQDIAIADGYIRVRPRSKPHGWSNVLTIFLDSLARFRKPAGVAVILSGLDSDGAAALKEFHERGGITIAQSLSSAEQKDMPRSAIATGFVNYVLQPEDIGAKIAEIARSGVEAMPALRKAGV